MVGRSFDRRFRRTSDPSGARLPFALHRDIRLLPGTTWLTLNDRLWGASQTGSRLKRPVVSWGGSGKAGSGQSHWESCHSQTIAR